MPNVSGLKGPLSCLTQARYGISWGVTGAAQACLAQVIDYTKSRVMFGKPLAATQAVQIRLAEMARKITTSQLLSLQLGRLKDAGQMAPTQVSMAKWHNTRSRSKWRAMHATCSAAPASASSTYRSAMR